MRREFSNWVRAQAALRANGKCECCTCRLLTGGYHYDHIIPDAMGGEPTVDNCAVLCRSCHQTKTSEQDVPRIAKTKRQGRKHLGIKKPRTIRSWRRFNGQIVHADRER
jgi:5-methylcytosine-specific restriction protein A